jgi:phosphate transport system substrate-binding protein
LHRKRLISLTVAALIASMTAATAIAVAAGSLTGAGSTLVAPLMAQWTSDFQHRTGVSVTYGPVGSGTGIADITSRSVDFGASDAPLTQSQASACNGCVQIPWGLTATAVAINVNGLRSIHLTGQVVAKIYLGQITNWNSPQIKKLNKHTNLPSLPITVVYRSDGSGDTYAFTNFLSKESSTWASRVGFATTVSFPTVPNGTGGKGNSGVTAIVSSTNGAIGYIAASYLIGRNLGVAALQNAAGNYEFPNFANIEAAGQTVTRVPNNNELHIVDPPSSASKAYPLSTFTYAIVPKASSSASLLTQFIKYALTTGQSFGPALDFAPLPKVVVKAAQKTANSLHS